MLTRVFLQILTLSLAASVVALTILLIRALFWRKIPARIQYAVWLLLLIRLMLPVLPASPITVFNIQSPVSFAAQTPDLNDGTAVHSNDKRNASPSENTSANEPSASKASIAPSASGKPILNQQSQQSAGTPTFYFKPGFNLETAAWIWFLGMVLTLFYVIAVNIVVRINLTKKEYCNSSAVIKLLNDCRLLIMIKKKVRILYSNKMESPAVFGILRPRIILSEALIDNADADTLKYVLLHELTHIKRHDNAISLLALLLNAINWFNPLLWYAFLKLKEDCELSCDASVLARLNNTERRSYGHTIINMMQASQHRYLPGSVGFTNNFTKRRIVMVAKGKKASVVITAAALALILLAGCASLPAEKAPSNTPPSSSPSSSSQNVTPPEDNGLSPLSTTPSSTPAPKPTLDNWIYYTKRMETHEGNVYPLYRAHTDGTEEMRVSDFIPNGYVVAGDWIYYCDYYGKGIFKIHGNGSGKVKISSITGSPAGFDSDYLYLYYEAKSDPKTGDAGSFLYRIKPDGTCLQKITKDSILYGIVINNGYIYYSDYVEDAPLYRMRPDGTNKQKLTSDKVGSDFAVYNNTIYYLNHGKNYFDGFGKIVRINLDGSGKKDLGIDNVAQLKVYNNHLYYSNSDGFFKADLNGKGITRLNSKSWEVTRAFGFNYNSIQ